MKKIRLTTAQALVRYLLAQKAEIRGEVHPLFAGVFAIFGHGNVAGLGEALSAVRDTLPTYRPHNEQGMAHVAIAYAKQQQRRRMMACTTSIGPGATNMVTAAALAHVNRLPVLLLPGDTFANRQPDPVLQQIENFSDPTVTANDCFKPVSRYWDRIMQPDQLLKSLPQAIRILTDPAECGPVTLALPQDVQAEACDYPENFFDEQIHRTTRLGPDVNQLQGAVAMIRQARRPLIIVGGGVHYSDATKDLAAFASTFRIPVVETQSGKGALNWEHPCNMGAIGVTGSSAANHLVEQSDLVIAIGTRLSDFTSGSGMLFSRPDLKLLSINVCGLDAIKYGSLALQSDAKRGIEELLSSITDYAAGNDWVELAQDEKQQWQDTIELATAPGTSASPSDAQVIGVVNAKIDRPSTVVGAAGGLPGELHKLWRVSADCQYHVEYGYSCMGYEIAGGLGVKMADPTKEVIVMVGDGSYLMLNSEIATAVMLDMKLIIVLLDNRGYGCINRLQQFCGPAPFNNLFADSIQSQSDKPKIDFIMHACSLGATGEKVDSLDELGEAMKRAFHSDSTYVIVIETDPVTSTEAGGVWWDVPVAEVSESESVQKAFKKYHHITKKR